MVLTYTSRIQHHNVGPRPLLLRRRGKLLWRTSDPLLPRRVRIRSHAWVCTVYEPVVYQEGTGCQDRDLVLV
jgi:hypothetical protein